MGGLLEATRYRITVFPLHFTPHCPRHTFASIFLQDGANPAYVQRQLGHASIQWAVDTYGKCLQMENKAAVDRLDEMSKMLVPRPTSPRKQVVAEKPKAVAD